MEPCLLVTLLVVGFGVIVYRANAATGRRGLTLDTARERFVEALERALDMPASDGLIEGTMDPGARRVTARVEALPEPLVIFTVEIGKGPKMRLTRENSKTALGKLLGQIDEVQVGDLEFDETIFIESDDGERTRKHLVKGKEFRQKVLRAFEHFGVSSVEVKRGFIEARVLVASLRRMQDYRRLLVLLARTASAYDRVNIKVRVLGRDGLALAGSTGRARCAYCHESVTGEEPDLIACEVCSTVLHEACYEELGQCPIPGCKGTKPERAARERG